MMGEETERRRSRIEERRIETEMWRFVKHRVPTPIPFLYAREGR
jgi:hypothetical protein